MFELKTDGGSWSKINPYEREHIEQILDQAAECTLYLKRKGDFPMDSPCPLALYGSGARRTIKGGTGSGEVNSRFSISIEEGLKRAGFALVTKDWLDAYDRVRQAAVLPWIRQLRKEARAARKFLPVYGMGAVMPEPRYEIPMEAEAEVAVYVLSRISGEGSDRRCKEGDYLLSETEIRDILYCQKTYKHFLLVLNVGGPVDLSPIHQKVDNILLISQLGVVTGDLLARLILGRDHPSGKLTTSWVSYESNHFIGEFANKDDTSYLEGIYVGYRYLDSQGEKALYPFGFGLSDSSFSWEAGELSLLGEDRIGLTARVQNVGSWPGKETLQLYVSIPEERQDQAKQSLAAFAKSPELDPGESAELRLEFHLRDLASYDRERALYYLERGVYLLRLGNSSRNTKLVGQLSLAEEIPLRQVRNAFAEPDFVDFQPQRREKETLSKELPCLHIPASLFSCQQIDYEAGEKAELEEIEEILKPLSNEELAYVTTGAFDPRVRFISAIGEASIHVSGAAGETTDRLLKHGVLPLIIADGPAGLRLNPHYVRRPDGSASVYGYNPMIDGMAHLIPKIGLWFMRYTANRRMRRMRKEGLNIYDQFATAIPIGTAIAQSWNLELAESWGDVVGDEMERFGIHLWLAPALNIHRSVLCGRNYEYFSEDPLISGLFAAAITRGVQKHPGCGTTIKHFAANNQETNRYGNNSHVSERALREIYLRGFEICIRESAPHALMTSYNLLNGKHTSCSRELNEDILRREFAFEGIVMTDWIVAGGTDFKGGKYPSPDPALVAAAGNDLFMPGSRRDYKALLAGLREGRVSRQELLRDASRVVRMARKLGKSSRAQREEERFSSDYLRDRKL